MAEPRRRGERSQKGCGAPRLGAPRGGPPGTACKQAQAGTNAAADDARTRRRAPGNPPLWTHTRMPWIKAVPRRREESARGGRGSDGRRGGGAAPRAASCGDRRGSRELSCRQQPAERRRARQGGAASTRSVHNAQRIINGGVKRRGGRSGASISISHHVRVYPYRGGPPGPAGRGSGSLARNEVCVPMLSGHRHEGGGRRARRPPPAISKAPRAWVARSRAARVASVGGALRQGGGALRLAPRRAYSAHAQNSAGGRGRPSVRSGRARVPDDVTAPSRASGPAAAPATARPASRAEQRRAAERARAG